MTRPTAGDLERWKTKYDWVMDDNHTTPLVPALVAEVERLRAVAKTLVDVFDGGGSALEVANAVDALHAALTEEATDAKGEAP